MSQQALEAARRFRPPGESIAPNTVSIVLVHDSGFTDTTDINEIIEVWNNHDTRGLLRAPRPAPVPPLNTLATGLLVEQFARHNHHPNLIVVSTTAPYGVVLDLDDKTNPGQHEGDQRSTVRPIEQKKPVPAFGRLKNGVPIFVASTAGYIASGVRDHFEGLWELNIDPTGSSDTRKRDDFARGVTDFVNAENLAIDDEIDPQTILVYPKNRLGLIDGQGNLYGTTRRSQWPDELVDMEYISVNVGDVSLAAKNFVTKEGAFSEGEILVKIGSYGGRRDPIIEVVVVGNKPGSARELFNVPQLYREDIPFTFGHPEVALEYMRKHNMSTPQMYPFRLRREPDNVTHIDRTDYQDDYEDINP